MASFINTNMVSLNTQSNLTKSQGALATSIQRLSSGLRVNGAKDDAAGMAIASRMDSTIKGQTVAVRNANDAISYSQTAEGALTKVADNLQRMRELAVQAANGTNGASDNASLNTEFAQLQAEITRVTNNTNFNGQNVLSGGAVTFQIGSGTTANDQISITGLDLTFATSETSRAAGSGNVAGATALGAAKTALGTATGTISYDAVTGHASSTAGGDAALLTAYNTLADASAIGVKIIAAAGATPATTVTGVSFDVTTGAAIAASSAAGADVTDVSAFNVSQASSPAVNLTNQSNARAAMTQIDKALAEVNNESIKQGANQNRFAAVITTLQTSTENQTAARSRIMDTDYASETAVMARGQILQQAGMAMLAQANQLPNGVMALMR